MANIERLTKLADHLLTLDLTTKLSGVDPAIGFNMQTFCSPWEGYTVGEIKHKAEDPETRNCGTTCCIGGWACLLFGEDGEVVSERRARHLLELTELESERLFYNASGYIAPGAWSANSPARGFARDLGDITLEEAYYALQRFIGEHQPAEESAE